MADPLVGEEEARAVYDVVLSGWLSAGPNVPLFEAAMAHLVGVPHAVAFCNGTVALHAILTALGVGPGDEVIVPDITFISTATAVLHAGATPVLCDVLEDSLNIDPAAAERLVTPQTRAIIPVHYAGQSADMDEVLALAERHGIDVIEDAAEAHGAVYKGREVGAFGKAAMFSFTPQKNVTTGEGGMVTTSDADLAEKLQALRNHGSKQTYVYEMLGFNYRMTEMQAAIGVRQLERLAGFLEHKLQMARLLDEAISAVPGLRSPAVLPERTHTYQMYTVTFDEAHANDRDPLRDHLEAAGIQTRICFPPLHQQPILAAYAPKDGRLATSTGLGTRILSLPFHNRMDETKIAYLAETLATFKGR
jgi:perosamine synthetase